MGNVFPGGGGGCGWFETFIDCWRICCVDAAADDEDAGGEVFFDLDLEEFDFLLCILLLLFVDDATGLMLLDFLPILL